ncbi:MAG: Na/Pi cotransporter family protein, partial [Bacteroidetes bacterium]|nr:Na/Pi cotransporter family protein [Bacteroidota bacterium]
MITAWFTPAATLLAGLAFFLFGLMQLTDALKRMAGSSMRTVLGRMTANRFRGVLAGAFVTSVIQSSSVTTVLVVGFISAGLMELTQAAGVIMGANIGTTITAQIISFKVSKAALALVAFGGLGYVFIKVEQRRTPFLALLALGLVFYGMSLMSSATAPLRDIPIFMGAMQTVSTPWAGVAVGAIFTALVQSSSATTAIVIVLASEGLIGLEGGIALALGANIGTCITAWLAAVGASTDAKRAALIHVLFNVIGVLIWIGLIDELILIVEWMTREAGLSGTRTASVRIPREIANAHTVFNVINTVLLIGFTTPLVRLVRKLVPDRAEEVPGSARPRFLDDALIDTPTLALDRVEMELGRMGERVGKMIALAADMSEGKDVRHAELRALDEELDALYLAINAHIGKVARKRLTGPDTERIRLSVGAATLLENMGDELESRFADDHMERARLRKDFHPQTAERIA